MENNDLAETMSSRVHQPAPNPAKGYLLRAFAAVVISPHCGSIEDQIIDRLDEGSGYSELYAALERAAAAMLGKVRPSNPVWGIIQAALAKARGEA